MRVWVPTLLCRRGHLSSCWQTRPGCRMMMCCTAKGGGGSPTSLAGFRSVINDGPPTKAKNLNKRSKQRQKVPLLPSSGPPGPSCNSQKGRTSVQSALWLVPKGEKRAFANKTPVYMPCHQRTCICLPPTWYSSNSRQRQVVSSSQVFVLPPYVCSNEVGVFCFDVHIKLALQFGFYVGFVFPFGIGF